MVKRLAVFLFFIAAVFLCAVGYARFIEPDLLTVRSFSIQTERPIRPCKIAFFTDTHFGKYYDESKIENIVKKINERNADIVIFGGDLIDNYARDHENMDLEYLKTELAKIKAKAGKFAVWGNHDYGGGAVRIYQDFMASCGFTVLNDESHVLEEYGIRLIGYDDTLLGWTDPSLYTVKSDWFHVIIAHEPVVSQFIKSESDNLLLSGHTHGGQVSIPFLTAKLLPEGSGQFVKGFYTAKEIGTTASLQMYVSSGTGMTRYPFRFFNIPEIVELSLQTSH